MWLNHHRLFSLMHRVDHLLLVLNGLLMMGVTITPFTTSLVADHYGHAGARLAANVYSGIFVVIAIIFNALVALRLVGAARAVDPQGAPRQRRGARHSRAVPHGPGLLSGGVRAVVLERRRECGGVRGARAVLRDPAAHAGLGLPVRPRQPPPRSASLEIDSQEQRRTQRGVGAEIALEVRSEFAKPLSPFSLVCCQFRATSVECAAIEKCQRVKYSAPSARAGPRRHSSRDRSGRRR